MNSCPQKVAVLSKLTLPSKGEACIQGHGMESTKAISLASIRGISEGPSQLQSSLWGQLRLLLHYSPGPTSAQSHTGVVLENTPR